MATMNSLAKPPVHSQKEHICLPWLWPMCAFEGLMDDELQTYSALLDFATTAYKLDYRLTPVWATANTVKLDTPTMFLRDFSQGQGRNLPVIIDAPYAGHSATIADYSAEQSLVRTLKENGIERVYVTDWKSATDAMKDFTIDTYLNDLNAAVDSVGGKAHLLGLCQGGWLSTAYAARFPNKVQTLVLAGAPIDTNAGNGDVKNLAHTLPMSFYQGLVLAGGGKLLGKFMLAGWKSMHPTDQYVKKYLDLFTHIEDKDYIKRAEEFSRWYEAPLDLPGIYYLQAVEWLFKENRLAKGAFVALGQRLSLKDVVVPTYLLAGSEDDITPPVQVFNAVDYLGTLEKNIVKKLVPGGHIGLFMGRATLQETWPQISRWLLSHESAS